MTQVLRRIVGPAAVLIGLGAFGAGPSPLWAQATTFIEVASVPGPAEAVEVEGTRLFVSADRTLRILDVTDAAAPRQVGSFTFPERITMFATSATAVYAVTEAFGVRILDVADVASPALRGALAMRGENLALAVPRPGILLVTNYSSGLNVLDVADPAKPVRLSSFVGDGYIRGVAASGAIAYVTDWPTGLYIFDLAALDAPEVTQLLHTPETLTPSVALFPAGGAAPPSTVAALDAGGILQVFDVSRRAAAAKTAVLRVPGTARRMKAHGQLAYIASGGEGVQVIDVTDAARPALAGGFKTMSPARDIALGNGHVFVATQNGGVLVLRPAAH